MSDTPPSASIPPHTGSQRRIVPQLGPHVWQADGLDPSDWMLPLGAEAAAAIGAMIAAPGAEVPEALAPVLAQIVERCDHGQGMVLLRGLPGQGAAEAAATLGALGGALGQPLREAHPAGGGVPDCDIFLIAAIATVELTLVSAGAAHNALMLADRPALERLYRPMDEAGQGPSVFSLQGGTFSGRFDPGKGSRGPLVPLAAVCADPSLPLRVTLRAGDMLCLNPFLVWPQLAEPGAKLEEALLVQPLRMAVSRLGAPSAAPGDEVGG
ncbi:hypothetical protein IAI18_16025 [Acetobacteraceae bacterium H6797]|nr:hypothetical protein [Acetobacteraceae bacterium H6797]